MGWVSRESYERSVARVRRGVGRPHEGLHGPGSTSWMVAREAVVFLGGGAAALLQLAHPFVAHAVDQHSETRRDPVGRFNRTFRHVYAILFGDLEGALASSRRVRRIHEGIVGTVDEDVGACRAGQAYAANDAEALLWVHATLIHTAVQVFERTVRPLREEEKDRYWEESKDFARLFGVPDEVLPADWPAFLRWWEGMLAGPAIAVGRPAREIAGFLLKPPRRAMAPFSWWYRRVTAGLLPPRLREAFGLRWSARDARLFEASMGAVRAAHPALPARLRYVPAYVEARRRLAGQEGPDRFGRAVEQAVLRALEPKPA
ncbi:MAG TPA: oxygenase MpaB family protein [Polyangiaceae bacterium LLY-WYZ-15_(1-7)]|nr:oxygenase MpaB family protein [Polyangiaceae bacterium LLY-WYZ-15_(1-7)]HJL09518.1 oxygenase MpaB family protein [Polyangiaceae bacterium LLY-WYZ-15_(1-7)]HJL27288.1 oxygenase MpaB family protein [Polyangiaceae bacterium LLY-WYZ-15_(1-7)]